MDKLNHNLAEVGADCISRQAAIKAVSEYGCMWMEYTRGMTKDEIAQRALNNAKATMIRIVKELPSAQPTHWIPCSERMPETDEDGYSDKLLVCFSNFTGHEICEYRIIDGIGKWYFGDSDDCPDDIGVKVIAWMHLPEPYKGEAAADMRGENT